MAVADRGRDDADARRRRRGGRASRQHPALHRRRDLRAHQRLPEAALRRHRLRTSKPARCWRRSTRRKSISSCSRRKADLATAASERQSGEDDRRSLSRPDQDRLGRRSRISTTRTAASKRKRRRSSRRPPTSSGSSSCKQFKTHLRPVRRRDHRAQHRHRGADWRRQQRQGALPHRLDEPASHLRQRAAALFARGARRDEGADRAAEHARPVVHRTLARTAQSIDRGLAHAADRDRPGQPGRRDPAGLLRRGAPEAGRPTPRRSGCR